MFVTCSWSRIRRSGDDPFVGMNQQQMAGAPTPLVVRRSVSRRALLRTTAAVSGVVATSPVLGQAAFAAAAESTDGFLPAWARQYAPGVSGPFDPTTGMFNWRTSGAGENVARTRSSLTGAFSSDQHHLFVGDSVTAGWNSLSLTFSGTIDRDKSWPYYYRRALTTRLGLPEGGTGMVRTFELNGMTTPYVDGRWSPAPNGIGVQAKGHFVQVSNATLTFNSAAAKFTPVSGDTVAVMYIDAGNFAVSIDGKAFVTVPGGKTGVVKRYAVAGLANTPHKVAIRTGLGVSAKIVGAEVYQQRGISAHNVAQGGSGVTGNTQKDWSYSADGTAAGSMSRCFSNCSGYCKPPSTVFVCLGGNDLNSNKTNLGAIRDGILETANYYRANSDIVIIAEAHGSQTFSKVDIKPLLGMLYQLCYDNNWPLWDLEHFTGGFEAMKAAGLTGDAYGHLTPAGYALMGQTMAGIVAGSLT